MNNPKNLDELFGIYNSGRMEFGGGHWHNVNYYPGSEDAKTAEFGAELNGQLATSVPYCPYWELIRECAILVGFNPEELPNAKHFCGILSPSHLIPGSFTSHGPRSRTYSSCIGLAMLMSDQLRKAKTTPPNNNEMSTAHRLPPEKRDRIFAKADAFQEGRVLRREFRRRVQRVTGEPTRDQREAIEFIEKRLQLLCRQVFGEETSIPPVFFSISRDGCQAAPRV